MKIPQRNSDVTFELMNDGTEVLARTAEGTVQHLMALEAAAFLAVDGERDVMALHAQLRAAVDPSISRERVFQALDLLADAGLLAERVSPPAGPFQATRRDIVKLLGAAAAYAVTMPIPGAAAAPPAHAEQHQKRAADNAEQAHKGGAAREQEAKSAVRGPAHSEPNRKRAAEEDEKQAAEQDQKKAAEQEQKKAAEQDQKKASEQQQKKMAEQEQKKAAEQEQKCSAEKDSKQSVEDELTYLRERGPQCESIQDQEQCAKQHYQDLARQEQLLQRMQEEWHKQGIDC